MNYSQLEIWVIIIGMGIGTYIIRFSFFGPLANKQLPDWALRMLRYTPVAVMPGLVAPLVLWPQATDGVTDIPRLLAAFTTVTIGYLTRNVLWAIVGGGAMLTFSQMVLT